LSYVGVSRFEIGYCQKGMKMPLVRKIAHSRAWAVDHTLHTVDTMLWVRSIEQTDIR